MHNADAFHNEVDAYPAITIIRRQVQGSAIVASAAPEAGNVGSRQLREALLACARNTTRELVTGIRTAVVKSWFKGADPWPCHSPDQLALLRRLEDQFPTLESNARVGIGVATGNDQVFITKDARLVEPSRLLKLALVKDLCQGALNWSGHYLVDPWDTDGLVDLNQFPKLRGYFEKHSVALKKRHTATKNAHGWFRTIDRVTHSLIRRPKLYIADIKNVLDPVLDAGETYPHHNLYYVQSDDWDLEVLGGLLMSAVGQFFVESYGVRMRGGYLRFQAQYLRRIRVPDPKTITRAQSDALRDAFRKRDRQRVDADCAENLQGCATGDGDCPWTLKSACETPFRSTGTHERKTRKSRSKVAKSTPARAAKSPVARRWVLWRSSSRTFSAMLAWTSQTCGPAPRSSYRDTIALKRSGTLSLCPTASL